MNHPEIKERIMALEDGELAAAERAELEAHLSGCASCRAALDGWRAARRAFFPQKQQKPTRAETEFFVRAVMARVEKPAFDWKKLVAPAFGLAFATAALSLALPRTPADPAEALIERETGLYAWASQPAPASHDEVLAFATEDR